MTEHKVIIGHYITMGLTWTPVPNAHFSFL